MVGTYLYSFPASLGGISKCRGRQKQMFSMDTETKCGGPSVLAEMLWRYRNLLWRSRARWGRDTRQDRPLKCRCLMLPAWACWEVGSSLVRMQLDWKTRISLNFRLCSPWKGVLQGHPAASWGDDLRETSRRRNSLMKTPQSLPGSQDASPWKRLWVLSERRLYLPQHLISYSP